MIKLQILANLKDNFKFICILFSLYTFKVLRVRIMMTKAHFPLFINY